MTNPGNKRRIRVIGDGRHCSRFSIRVALFNVINHRYQRKGYGLKAADIILEWMRNDGKYDKVVLCYIDGDEAAKKLYEKLGFYPTGEVDGDEIIMEKRLR